MKTVSTLALALVASLGTALAAININTATPQELEALRGISPENAKAIVAYRQKNGPFKTLRDVEKVPGLTKEAVARVRSDISFAGKSSLGPEAPKPAERPRGEVPAGAPRTK